MATPTLAYTELEYEQIASLAFELWEARGCPEGSPGVDWLRAEQELIAAGSGSVQLE